MKSYLAKQGEVAPQWYVVDATGLVLGRLAAKIANTLRGRNKPTYTPHIDTGDYVIVINADKVAVTGRKEEQKEYMFYTGYMGNEKHISLKEFRKRRPQFIIEHSVKGMMPRNRLARAQMSKLKIYAGPEHPHAAQNPQPLA